MHYNSKKIVCLSRIENFWQQIWSQVAFFYKHIFTMMSNNGTLIIANEFHKASLHVVFIPAFQRDVDQIVVTWNVHNVHKIIENRRFIPSHVPTQVFQPHERKLRQVIHTYYATFKHIIWYSHHVHMCYNL
jgi:hypothetical protein